MSLGNLYLLGFNLIEIKTMILRLQFYLQDVIFLYLYNNFVFMMNYIYKKINIFIYDHTVDFIWGSTYYTNYYSQVFSFIIYKKKFIQNGHNYFFRFFFIFLMLVHDQQPLFQLTSSKRMMSILASYNKVCLDGFFGYTPLNLQLISRKDG